MVAFVASVLISIGLFGVGIWYMHRRPVDPKGTWGESMVGAVYVFGTLFWIFGVVPHQFILWADSDLGWRVDRFLVGPGEILSNLPFVIPYSALRDIMVVNIHVVYVAARDPLRVDQPQRAHLAAGELDQLIVAGTP